MLIQAVYVQYTVNEDSPQYTSSTPMPPQNNNWKIDAVERGWVLDGQDKPCLLHKALDQWDRVKTRRGEVKGLQVTYTRWTESEEYSLPVELTKGTFKWIVSESKRKWTQSARIETLVSF
jgi:hypothetical protein